MAGKNRKDGIFQNRIVSVVIDIFPCNSSPEKSVCICSSKMTEQSKWHHQIIRYDIMMALTKGFCMTPVLNQKVSMIESNVRCSAWLVSHVCSFTIIGWCKTKVQEGSSNVFTKFVLTSMKVPDFGMSIYITSKEDGTMITWCGVIFSSRYCHKNVINIKGIPDDNHLEKTRPGAW